MATALLEKNKLEKQLNFSKNNRLYALDILRGASMIFVVFYHLFYDLIFMKDVKLEFFFSDWFDNVHTFFLIILFSVSGICTAFSKNSLKRGAFIFLLGEGLTIASNLFSAADVFVFGVLSFFGISMILTSFLDKIIAKINPILLFSIAVILYIIFFDFARENGTLNFIFTEIKLELPTDRLYLYPIGITHANFSSMDYFPLLPNFFVFLAGVSLAKPIKERKFPAFLYILRCKPIEFIGKNSLAIYIIHQPILMLIFLL